MKKKSVEGRTLAIFVLVAVIVDYACAQNNSSDYDQYSDIIETMWNNLTQPRPSNQLRIAFLTTSADYITAAQTILYAYSRASQNASAQQLAIDVQILPILVPNLFPFSFTQATLAQLFNFQVDLIISDGSWVISGLADALHVPAILLYSTFPNPALITSIIGDFIFGFYPPHLTTPPQDQFYSLYSLLTGSQYFDAYSSSYYYFQDGGNYYPDTPNYYYPLPSNYPNFQLPLISYNPYLQQYDIININITIILDSNMPYEMDMQFFQTITASDISKTPTNVVYIASIPRNPTQQQLNNMILSLQQYTGPRFVYATSDISVGLIHAINRLGAFSTSFGMPMYQWHFLNLTGGNASHPELLTDTCSPYIYHWEIYDLNAFSANCPLIALNFSSGNYYNRIIECDFGYYLNNIAYSYVNQMDSLCQYEAGVCKNKAEILRSILANPLSAPNSPSFATGPMSYSGAGQRQGMMVNLFLGVDAPDARLRSQCSATDSTNSWNCTSFNYSVTTSTQKAFVNVLIVAYYSEPFFYINTTTGLFDGFYVALTKLLVQQIGIVNYTIYGDSDAGIYNPDTASWSGCIGEVLGSADIAMVPTEGISNLTNTLSFSTPYVQLSFSVVQQVPDPSVTFGALFTQIFRPLTYVNWIIQVGIIIFVSILLTAIDYFSPNLVTFNLRRSWFYVFARSVMGAGGQNPDVFSSQILMLFWSFFTMITISTYTANLAALSIDQQMTSPYVSKFADLINGQWQPCCIANSFTTFYFMQSTVPLEVAVWQLMSQCQFSSQLEAFESLSNWSNPNATSMALVTLQPAASFAANTYANLIITANYSLVNLVLAVPNGLLASVPVSNLNSAIQNLSTTGTLTRIINQYLRMPYTTFPPTGWSQLSDFFYESAYTTQFTIQTQSGIYLIIGFGIVFSLGFAGVEQAFSFVWKAYTSRKKEKMKKLVEDLIASATVELPEQTDVPIRREKKKQSNANDETKATEEANSGDKSTNATAETVQVSNTVALIEIKAENETAIENETGKQNDGFENEARTENETGVNENQTNAETQANAGE